MKLWLFALAVFISSEVWTQSVNSKVYGKWLIYREYDRITGVEHKPTNWSVEFTLEGTAKFSYSDSTFATTNANLTYPLKAKRKRIVGMVVVRFMIEKDGSISNIELLQDIGGGCGQAALDVVPKMPGWNPGPVRGRPKKVRFVLPVKFKLE
jgi:TonB family protein